VTAAGGRDARRSAVTAALAPGLLVRGRGALAELGEQVAALGARPLVVLGERGYPLVEDTLVSSLGAAGVAWAVTQHVGPVTLGAIDRLAEVVRTGAHDVVLGVGGGRVLDAAKAAADQAGRAFVAVPTSPATSAATTALCVLYDEANVWSGPLFVRRCPDVAVIDADLLAAAPDRLLVAGVLDALCKVEEVRLAARLDVRPDALLGAALGTCDALASYVAPESGALREGLLPTAGDERAALAEAVVVLPGLIAGLVGEANKLAAAHAVHNALTRLPDHHRALHGELVTFGMLVQLALTGAEIETLRPRAGWVARLGVDASLEGLGCANYRDDPEPLLEVMAAAPALRRAFPAVTLAGLRAAIDVADAVAADARNPLQTNTGASHRS
jgi:glycerol dehydrogenase